MWHSKLFLLAQAITFFFFVLSVAENQFVPSTVFCILLYLLFFPQFLEVLLDVQHCVLKINILLPARASRYASQY